jgi:hypothetical protein
MWVQFRLCWADLVSSILLWSPLVLRLHLEALALPGSLREAILNNAGIGQEPRPDC